MNSRQLLFIVAAMIVILALLYFAMGRQNSGNSIPQYIETPSGDEYLPQEFDTNDIVTITDVSKIRVDVECEELEGELRDGCYVGRATVNYDETKCDAIESVAIKDGCFLKVAIDGGKADVCENLTSGKSECYSILALKQKDPRLCESIPKSREICLDAYRKKDSGNCLEADFYTRQCNEAVAFNDISYCEGIVDFSEECYLSIATETNNADLCAKITVSQDHCYYQIAINTNNVNICNLLAEGRDNCVADIAFDTNNKALCDQAGTQKESCLEDLS